MNDFLSIILSFRIDCPSLSRNNAHLLLSKNFLLQICSFYFHFQSSWALSWIKMTCYIIFWIALYSNFLVHTTMNVSSKSLYVNKFARYIDNYVRAFMSAEWCRILPLVITEARWDWRECKCRFFWQLSRKQACKWCLHRHTNSTDFGKKWWNK